MSENLRLQAPWVTYYNMVAALFEGDEEVTVSPLGYDQTSFTITTTNHDKYMSMRSLMQSEVQFGNIKVNVDFVYDGRENGQCGLEASASVASLFGRLFKGNPHVKQVKTVYAPWGAVIFCIFKKEVIQFYNDDISDLYGNWNGLMEDIARKVFETAGINFCTDIE